MSKTEETDLSSDDKNKDGGYNCAKDLMSINVETFGCDGIREGAIRDEEDDKRGYDTVSD